MTANDFLFIKSACFISKINISTAYHHQIRVAPNELLRANGQLCFLANMTGPTTCFGDEKMSTLKATVEKLKKTGALDLSDFKSLKLDELDKLTEEIEYWCLYANGKPEKLGLKHKEH